MLCLPAWRSNRSWWCSISCSRRLSRWTCRPVMLSRRVRRATVMPFSFLSLFSPCAGCICAFMFVFVTTRVSEAHAPCGLSPRSQRRLTKMQQETRDLGHSSPASASGFSSQRILPEIGSSIVHLPQADAYLHPNLSEVTAWGTSDSARLGARRLKYHLCIRT